jgi:hypothetical protein
MNTSRSLRLFSSHCDTNLVTCTNLFQDDGFLGSNCHPIYIGAANGKLFAMFPLLLLAFYFSELGHFASLCVVA